MARELPVEERAALKKAWDHASWETAEIKHGTDLRTAFEAGWLAARGEPSGGLHTTLCTAADALDVAASNVLQARAGVRAAIDRGLPQ